MEQLMTKIWAWEAGSLKYRDKSAPANDNCGAEIVAETNWILEKVGGMTT